MNDNSPPTTDAAERPKDTPSAAPPGGEVERPNLPPPPDAGDQPGAARPQAAGAVDAGDRPSLDQPASTPDAPSPAPEPIVTPLSPEPGMPDAQGTSRPADAQPPPEARTDPPSTSTDAKSQRGQGDSAPARSDAGQAGDRPDSQQRDAAAKSEGTIRLEHPDGGVQRRDANGTNTFESPGGSTISIHPDGPVVASHDVKLEATPDGDIQGTTKDGYKVTASPKGDMLVQAPDGNTRGIGRDGTISVSDGGGWSMISSSDGSKSTETVRGPDGTTLGRDSEGTTSVGKPDGSQTTFYRDGTIVHTAPDGTTTVKEPDGTISVTTPDGTTKITQPDGDLYIENPNGTITGPIINEPGLESVDPLGSVAVGAWEATRDLAELGWSTSPLRAMLDHDGWIRTMEGLASGVQHAINNPDEFVKAVIDYDTWRDDPIRALGHLVPDLIMAIVTGGGGAAATKLDDLAGAVNKLDNLAGASAASKVDGMADNVLTKGPDGVWRQPGVGDDIGEGLTVREGRGMDRSAAPSPSEALGASLRANGEVPPGPGHEAHHIIPSKAGGEALDGIREAARSELGTLDDASNGAWLPKDQSVANEVGSTLHMDYLHTDKGSELYAAEIERRFTGPDGEALQGQEFLDQLDQVKGELLSGDFRIRD